MVNQSVASQWPSFTKQKVFLATTLVRTADRQTQAMEREASLQGAISLLIDARRALLQLIADIYQIRDATPHSLDELADMLAGDRAELDELRTLAVKPGTWWQHIELLAQEQRLPAQRKAPVPRENVIAVSAETGADRSTAALLDTAVELKQYIEMILERHDEW